MRKYAYLVPLVSALVFSGCATVPTTAQHGNFIEKTDQANDKKIADDLVKQLVGLYPPAKTRFDLQHATPDHFGTFLIESLRGKGYAVLESKQPSDAATAPAGGLSLRYIVDQTKPDDYLRLSVIIDGKQSLDRLYQTKDGTLQAASYWLMRKE